MIRLLISLVMVGAVISCSMEDTETSGVLVDPNTAKEIPDWLSIADVDHNRDGIINIHDLVLVAHYFGQAVPADEIKSSSTEQVTGPCEYLKARRYFDIKTVDIPSDDNEELKETFIAPDGGRYAYALVVFARRNMEHSGYSSSDKIPIDHSDPACLAVRFFIDENFTPKNIKIKPISGPKDMFSETIESELDLTAAGTTQGLYPRYTAHYLNYDCLWPARGCTMTNRNWRWQVDVVYDFKLDETTGDIGKYKLMRFSKSGIPIGDERTIRKIKFIKKELTPTHGGSPHDIDFIYYWNIGESRERNRKNVYELVNYGFSSTWNSLDEDFGFYVKMLPSEVQRRYFPEDIE